MIYHTRGEHTITPPKPSTLLHHRSRYYGYEMYIRDRDHMKNKKYHNVGTITKSNIKIVERDEIDTSNVINAYISRR